MRFKVRGDHRARPAARRQTKPFWEDWDVSTKGDFPFTPLLNAAFDLVVLTQRERLPFEDRFDLFMFRSSWGNWYPYAVEVENPFVFPAQRRDWPTLEDLLFGGPCPLCGEQASDPILPINFRWHRSCIAVAYARDALHMGNADQRKWAANLLTELGA